MISNDKIAVLDTELEHLLIERSNLTECAHSCRYFETLRRVSEEACVLQRELLTQGVTIERGNR